MSNKRMEQTGYAMFPVALIKYPDKSNVWKELFILAYSWWGRCGSRIMRQLALSATVKQRVMNART